MLFVCSILLLLSFSDSSSLPLSSAIDAQKIIIQPSDITAVSGDKIILPCSVRNRQGSCQWTKNGFGLGTDPNLAAYSRYSLDNSKDHCDLIIDPVLEDDEAEYQCQIGPGSEVPGISSDIVRVTVYHEPGVPHIKQAKYGDVIEVDTGQELELECETQGGKPGADIVWRHGDGSKVEAEVMDIVTRLEDNKFRTTSVLKMIPEENEEIMCEAVSTILKLSKKSPAIKIRIKDKLSASLRFEPEVAKIGENINVECVVENGNSLVSYTWFINNVEMTTEKHNKIKLENVEAKHNDLSIKCVVKNNEETLEASGSLHVASPLRIVEYPGHVLARDGELVKLHCGAAGGQAEHSYVWTRVRDNKLLGVGQDLQIEMSQEMEGEISCTVISDQESQQATTELNLKHKPVVTAESDMTQYAAISSSAIITCNIENFYGDESQISWFKENKRMESDGSKYKIVHQTDDHKSDLLRSDLVILNVDETDFGLYSCEATNTEGQDRAEIELANENSGYFIVSIVVNIVGAIVVFGCIGIFVFMRRSRSSNVEVMEEEKKRYHENAIFKGADTGILDKLLIKNNTFNIDMEFNVDDLDESSTLKKPNRINRFYSAPNGSFHSDNTVISFVNDED